MHPSIPVAFPGTSRRRFYRARLSLAALALLAFASGCAVIDSHDESRFSGTTVSAETLQRIEPGVTTEAWLQAALGEPTRTTTVDATTHILSYASTHSRHSHATVLFLLNTSTHLEIDETLFFECRDGVVTRFWKESRRSDAS